MSDTPETAPPAPEPLTLEDRFLDGSTFTRVSLTRSIVADSHLMHARIDDVNAEGMVFENVNLSGATFHDVNLSGVTISDATLTNVTISDANLEGMRVNGILVTELLAKWNDG